MWQGYQMINFSLIVLALTVLMFFLLKKFSLKIRIITSVSVFLVVNIAFVALLVIIGDKPTDGSITITKEILEKEGNISKEEWDEYKKTHTYRSSEK